MWYTATKVVETQVEVLCKHRQVTKLRWNGRGELVGINFKVCDHLRRLTELCDRGNVVMSCMGVIGERANACFLSGCLYLWWTVGDTELLRRGACIIDSPVGMAFESPFEERSKFEIIVTICPSSMLGLRVWGV